MTIDRRGPSTLSRTDSIPTGSPFNQRHVHSSPSLWPNESIRKPKWNRFGMSVWVEVINKKNGWDLLAGLSRKNHKRAQKKKTFLQNSKLYCKIEKLIWITNLQSVFMESLGFMNN